MDFRTRSSLLRKITNRAEALKVIGEVSFAYYALAIVLILVALFTQTTVWIDAIIYALLGFWLGRFYSRVAAVVLFLVALTVFVVTFANVPGLSIQGRNALVGLLMMWTSARAVEATFKLYSRFANEPDMAETG